jgi:hypothetical protein
VANWGAQFELLGSQTILSDRSANGGMGFRVVDLSDVLSPKVVGTFQQPGSASAVLPLITYGNYLLAGADRAEPIRHFRHLPGRTRRGSANSEGCG